MQATAKREVVEAIMTAWSKLDADGVLELLCDDVEHHYLVGERPLQGKEWVRKFLTRMAQHTQALENWRIVRCAETDDALLLEGVDDYISSEGVRVRYPYMGVFQFRDGKVSHWRDYCDAGLISRMREGESPPVWLEALIAETP